MQADAMIDFLFASQDASTASLVWCLTLMADHPDVLAKVGQPGGAPGATVTVRLVGQGGSSSTRWAKHVGQRCPIVAAPSSGPHPAQATSSSIARTLPPFPFPQVREEQLRVRPDPKARLNGEVLAEMPYTRQVGAQRQWHAAVCCTGDWDHLLHNAIAHGQPSV